jgi:hypothetical protein
MNRRDFIIVTVVTIAEREGFANQSIDRGVDVPWLS